MKNRIGLTRLAGIGMGIMLIFGTAACGQEELSERGRIAEETEGKQVIEDELATGYLEAWDGMVVHSDNKYYSELIQLIDALAAAPEEECDDSEWNTLWQLKHSSGNTGITIQINKDLRDAAGMYRDEEDFLNHCSFRVSGTIRGESIDKCMEYGDELKALQPTLEAAHGVELLRQNVKEEIGQTEGFEAYYQLNLGQGLVFLTSDEQGRIVMLTDSDLTELDSLSGCNRRVRVYDFHPATDEEAEGFDPKPQIVGKIEFIETF